MIDLQREWEICKPVLKLDFNGAMESLAAFMDRGLLERFGEFLPDKSH